MTTTPPVPLNAVNPFKELRETHNDTLEHFAKRIGISKQALIRLEQGTYVAPLPAALQFCASAFTVTEYDLLNQYEAFQTANRLQHHRWFGDLIEKFEYVESKHPEVSYHPMRLLRGTINPTQVAKGLCIPQATLTYFERNVVQQKSVPKVILNVLFEIGYTDAEITYFIKKYDEYRQQLVTKRTESGKRVDYGYVPKPRRAS